MTDEKMELIKTADLIRNKYRALKRGRVVEEESRIENLKPIVGPLKELIEAQKSFTPSTQLALPPPSTPLQIAPATPLRLATPSRSPLQITPDRMLILGEIARGYLSIHMSKENLADTTYGFRYDNF